ncbi:adenosine monophosphate-protein transferase [Thermogymnomonas acidicola]|uniref:Adenosine monophosphate-protein transferase n=2 Tax=Thermogymnomonas acidicola TaxID=399579 RepID=A0AA37BSD3_9ARCH|nr:adenosine-specific kinase [Thermogymnomonas acidicola]GGM78331.1 adenosine monophosphate-protein transferase [Thermogymnomonas acidicola]
MTITMVEIDEVRIDFPQGCNVILGYSHFIKTVEDLYEIVSSSVPGAKFGLAFSEASGDRLIRYEGTDQELINVAVENLKRVSAGHTFMVVLRNAYPINVLNAVKMCQEVGSVFAATANPLSVIVARTERGNGVLGVVDGYSPLGVEGEEHRRKRKELLRNIGYKL